MERPPARTEEPWRPWLMRVAINLGRDCCAAASAAPTSDLAAVADRDRRRARRRRPTSCRRSGGTTEGRYDLLESVSFAFLLALEALTPQQRAVLLLRDVFDYSVRETAAALGMSEPNVKTTHHRARRAMAAYDRGAAVPTRGLQARTRGRWGASWSHSPAPRRRAMEALLAETCAAVNDGGEFAAAHRAGARPRRVHAPLLRPQPPSRPGGRDPHAA